MQAKLQHLHISPRKVRLVASLIKGMDLKRAELELDKLPKRSSAPLLKLLKSAADNAVNNFQKDPAVLYIREVTVNEGPVMKRMRPRAFGRGAAIRKRMSHILIVLDTKSEPKVKTTRRKAKSKTG